jgi:folate-binding protein YgfZ
MYSTEGYQALRASSAVVRRADRGVLAVTGPDRLVWLQGLLTNDVAALGPGDSRYAAYLTPQGRMITDLRVINLADRALLEVPASLAETLRARLEALLFAEDAEVSDVSASTAVIDLHGPDTPQVTARARAAIPLTSLEMIRDDVYRVPGATWFVPRDEADAVVRALTEAGAIETTLETLDVVRVEAGRPAFLADMDEHTIPLEAGIEDRAISLTKGCYVGQEIIIRVLHRGHGRVARKLVGLMLDPGASAPARGAGIASGSREIGAVTSAVESPDLGRPIALGYVHRDFVQPGTAVEIAGIPASVAALPFIPVTPLI